MDYIKVLQEDLGKGFNKSDLERLIGLPLNNLSGVLAGKKKLSKKSELKIEVWEKSKKPNPLELIKPQKKEVVIQDLNKKTNILEAAPNLPKTNYTINIEKPTQSAKDEIAEMLKQAELESKQSKIK